MRISRAHVKNVELDHWGERWRMNGVAEHDEDVDSKRHEDVGEVPRRYVDEMGRFTRKGSARDQPQRRVIPTDHDRLHA